MQIASLDITNLNEANDMTSMNYFNAFNSLLSLNPVVYSKDTALLL